ncbi:phenylalanine--tRNA ligase subunit beta [Candidatus Saccharibacteria bacterium]|nr:phenylalanine--tRNA ligase subunit beta [Candidatus Saccharibacteria bacterium]
MKISLNWLKKYVNIPVSDEELVRLIGARLVEVEGVIDETKKYNNIYIVKVETCEKIPDTHLSLCQINDGGSELVQVVCGAPNVRAGMLAVWIKPGAIVPASVHEDAPFVIGKRKMLGKYESNGMLAGADELDFGDDHSGIVEIDPEMAKPGELLADVFDLNDLVLEIENKSLTHRPDCFGIVGFAREIAGILGEQFVLNPLDLVHSRPSSRGSFASLGQQPSRGTVSRVQNQITVEVIDANICSRYSAVVLEKHGEMKKKYLTWQDTILSKSGMRPIDPIVDATNYLMLLTGQPLHAFDYDKFVKVGKSEKAEIKVRLARKGERLTLIDEKEVELNENDIVICSNDTPVALAGAMGGKETEITAETRKIIIESATFSLYNLRKTQMAHGIFSEAITRFTKGQPAYQTLIVANKCAEMLSEGFKVIGIADECPEKIQENIVKITDEEINGLLGTNYSTDLIIKTLENVNFVIKNDGNILEVKVPAWRTDIHIKEDIIEEVGRLLGYDNILPTLPLHKTASKNKMLELKRETREMMKRFGASEVLTYSFVSEKLLEKAGLDAKNSYRIVNSISPELQYIRQSLIPSLLEKTYLNSKIPVEKFAIYEMNKVYRKEWGLDEEDVPVEKMRIGLVVYERKNSETAYYKAKKYAEEFLKENRITAEFLPIKESDAEARPFEKKRAAEIRLVDGTRIGAVGEFKNSVKRNFKLGDYLAGFEIDFDKVLELKEKKKEIGGFELKKKEDITVTSTKTYREVLREIEVKYPDAKITPVGIYQPEGSSERNLTFHLEFF